jgi:hypothetical protein
VFLKNEYERLLASSLVHYSTYGFLWAEPEKPYVLVMESMLGKVPFNEYGLRLAF